jgi:hypothetical protein
MYTLLLTLNNTMEWIEKRERASFEDLPIEGLYFMGGRFSPIL